MLARANRVARAEDFRQVVRRGRRSTTPNAVYYRLARDPQSPARFGFIISRAVGPAVVRNRLRRRLRAIGRELVDAGGRGSDVVVRALPGSADRGFAELVSEMHRQLDDALVRRSEP